jgi:hypothetical protein
VSFDAINFQFPKYVDIHTFDATVTRILISS